jgi:hypothetical protein
MIITDNHSLNITGSKLNEGQSNRAAHLLAGLIVE